MQWSEAPGKIKLYPLLPMCGICREGRMLKDNSEERYLHQRLWLALNYEFDNLSSKKPINTD